MKIISKKGCTEMDYFMVLSVLVLVFSTSFSITISVDLTLITALMKALKITMFGAS